MKKWLFSLWVFSLFYPVLHGQNNPSSCNAPVFTIFDQVTTTSVSVQWVDFNNNVEGWEIEWGSKGFSRTMQPSTGILEFKTFTLTDLEAGHAYDVYVRTVCSENSKSGWSGPFQVRSAIQNGQSCDLALDIKDNSCPRLENFFISVDEFPGKLLGKDVSIASVDLIIEHTWPADLQIELESPSGLKIPLSTYRGIGMENFGNPNEGNCLQTASFSDLACLPIGQHSGQSLTGFFSPETPLSDLYDDTQVNGMWKIVICDRALDDVGVLRYARIQFEPVDCPIPINLSVSEISNSSIKVNWDRSLNCNNAIIHVVFSGNAPGSHLTFFTSCFNEELVITGLIPETAYDIYIQADCNNTRSTFSCPASFETTCQDVTLSESFDSYQNCDNNCLSECKYTFNGWHNAETDDQDWLVSSGSTLSSLTGPTGDISGTGQYVYIENSPDICGAKKKAILESTCLDIPFTEDQCDMSFYYHMFGDGIDSLKLEISIDAGNTWQVLFDRFGDQGDVWHRAILDLSPYQGNLALMRFTANTGINTRGDIALDQIDFFGTTMNIQLPIYFADMDNDGFGDPNNYISICMSEPPEGFVRNADDCDDLNPNINPDAEEIPCNLIDENCSGMEDDVPVENPIISMVTMVRNESCPNASDGSIGISVTGGVPPYDIEWNNGKKGNVVTDLSTGLYFAIISDAGSCISRSQTVTINLTNSPNIFITEVKNTLCAQNTGLIDIEVTGGAPPYTYTWSNGMKTQDLLNIGTGSYTVSVTDQNGCSVSSSSILIEATPRFTAGIQVKRNPICHGSSNGLLSIGIINALPPIEYKWNTGDITSSLQGLTAGKYSVTINDARGCNQIIETELTDPARIEPTVVGIKSATCFNESSGAIQVSTTGGSAPFEFNWSSPDHNTFSNNINTEDLTNIPPGKYQLFVNDANGCTGQTELIQVENASPIQIQVNELQNASCRLSENGMISVHVSGGGGDFIYFWNNEEGPPVLENIKAGSYSIRVIDRFGCKASDDNLKVGLQNIPVAVNTKVLDGNLCHRDSFGVISALAESSKFPIDFNWSNGKQRVVHRNTDTLFMLPSGQYDVTVTDNEGCVGASLLTGITPVPELLISNIQVSMNECNSDNDGSIEVQVSGGVPPYKFMWSDGQTTQKADGLSTGQYVLTVMDANDCVVKSQNITISVVNPIRTEVSVIHTSGNLKNGSITLNVTGATPPYRIDWNDLPNGPLTRSNLAAGRYCVTITDNKGCFEGLCIDVDQSTSVTTPFTTDGILIGPNPFTDHLQIISDLPIEELFMFNVHGNTVFHGQNLAEYWKKDFSLLEPGIYFLKINTNQYILTRKVIKIK